MVNSGGRVEEYPHIQFWGVVGFTPVIGSLQWSCNLPQRPRAIFGLKINQSRKHLCTRLFHSHLQVKSGFPFIHLSIESLFCIQHLRLWSAVAIEVCWLPHTTGLPPLGSPDRIRKGGKRLCVTRRTVVEMSQTQEARSFEGGHGPQRQ